MKRTVLTALVLLAGLALTGAETTPRVSVSSPKSELAFEKESGIRKLHPQWLGANAKKNIYIELPPAEKWTKAQFTFTA